MTPLRATVIQCGSALETQYDLQQPMPRWAKRLHQALLGALEAMAAERPPETVRVILTNDDGCGCITDRAGLVLECGPLPHQTLAKMGFDRIAYFNAHETHDTWALGERVQDQGW